MTSWGLMESSIFVASEWPQLKKLHKVCLQGSKDPPTSKANCEIIISVPSGLQLRGLSSDALSGDQVSFLFIKGCGPEDAVSYVAKLRMVRESASLVLAYIVIAIVF